MTQAPKRPSFPALALKSNSNQNTNTAARPTALPGLSKDQKPQSGALHLTLLPVFPWFSELGWLPADTLLSPLLPLPQSVQPFLLELQCCLSSGSLFPEEPRSHCPSQVGQEHGLSALQEARRMEADDMTLELSSLSIKVNTTHGVMVRMFRDTNVWCGPVVNSSENI